MKQVEQRWQVQGSEAAVVARKTGKRLEGSMEHWRRLVEPATFSHMEEALPPNWSASVGRLWYRT